MSTPVTNFGKVTVSTGYTSGDVTIVVTTGHGSRLPSDFPYPLVWWNSTAYTDPADDPNKEIVLVTARSGDTLTVTRAQEGTAATAKNTGSAVYKMVLSITKAMWDALNNKGLKSSFRGLRLRTHPSQIGAAEKVFLTHADAIVMDDGEEVKDWNSLEASILVSGAGGIDTGSYVDSTWYEIYAIRNPTSGARNLLLHKAKKFTLDENITTGEDASQGIASLLDNSNYKVAQGFKTDFSGYVDFMDVKLLRTGNGGGGYLRLEIQSDAAGKPSGTVLAQADDIFASTISTSAQIVRVTFRTPATLTAGVQYHLVASKTVIVDAANYISWRMDGSAATYSKGAKALFDFDTTTWTTDTDDDLWLKVYVRTDDAPVTMPTGYTQRAHIGFCRIHGASQIQEFRQINHTVFVGYETFSQLAIVTATVSTMTETTTVFPPVPVLATLLVYNGTASTVAVGDMGALAMVTTPTDVNYSVARITLAAASVGTVGPIPVEYDALMAATSAGSANLYVNSYEW